MQYALTGGSAAREAELQYALQALLSRYDGSLQPVPATLLAGKFTNDLLFLLVLLFCRTNKPTIFVFFKCFVEEFISRHIFILR